jgi:hypothetical protein
MITGHKDFFILRAAQRGYELDDVMPCVVAQDGDMWTVDETHSAYPHPRPTPPPTHSVSVVSSAPIYGRDTPHTVLSYEEFNKLVASQSEYFAGVTADAAATYAAAQEKSRQAALPGFGPGTELKKLLAKIGIKATPTCSCNKRAQVMDEKGVQWCKDNIDTIVGWLREEATKRKLPFVDMAGKMLVKRAISLAEKAEKKRLATEEQNQSQDG